MAVLDAVHNSLAKFNKLRNEDVAVVESSTEVQFNQIVLLPVLEIDKCFADWRRAGARESGRESGRKRSARVFSRCPRYSSCRGFSVHVLYYHLLL